MVKKGRPLWAGPESPLSRRKRAYLGRLCKPPVKNWLMQGLHRNAWRAYTTTSPRHLEQYSISTAARSLQRHRRHPGGRHGLPRPPGCPLTQRKAPLPRLGTASGASTQGLSYERGTLKLQPRLSLAIGANARENCRQRASGQAGRPRPLVAVRAHEAPPRVGCAGAGPTADEPRRPVLARDSGFDCVLILVGAVSRGGLNLSKGP